MKLVAARQAARDIGGLQQSTVCRRVSGEVASNGDKDMATRLRVVPFVKLTHPGFKNLIGVKSRVLA